MRWCSGPCGRELALGEFDRRAICRACKRIKDRVRLRNKYRHDHSFAARVKARVRARYWAAPEKKRAAVAARALRIKLAA